MADFGDLTNAIEQADIETDKGFRRDAALAHLLLNGVIRVGTHEWEKDWPEAARNALYLGADVSDVFMWGCSESEEVRPDDIEPLWRAFMKDAGWGPAVWAIIKRRELPQEPVEEAIRKGGVWELDALVAEHGLRPNMYDGIMGEFSKQKYAAYDAWERAEGREPVPHDQDWWKDGWERFKAAHPTWGDGDDVDKGMDRLRDDWLAANGYPEHLPADPEPPEASAPHVAAEAAVEAHPS